MVVRQESTVALDNVIVFYQLDPAVALEEPGKVSDVAAPSVFLDARRYESGVDQIVVVGLVGWRQCLIEIPYFEVQVVRLVINVGRKNVNRSHLWIDEVSTRSPVGNVTQTGPLAPMSRSACL